MEGHSEGVGHDDGQGKARYCRELAKKAGANSMAMDAGKLLTPTYRESRFWGTDLSEIKAEEPDESKHF